jgi:hypothetical protein
MTALSWSIRSWNLGDAIEDLALDVQGASGHRHGPWGTHAAPVSASKVVCVGLAVAAGLVARLNLGALA